MTTLEKAASAALFIVAFAIGWAVTDDVKDAYRKFKNPPTELESRFSIYRETHDGIAVRVLTDKNTGAEYIVINSNAIIQTK